MSLSKLTWQGEVESVFVSSPYAESSVSKKVEKIFCEIGIGVRFDRHSGLSRPLDARESLLLSLGLTKGAPIFNARQISLVSREELTEIAVNLGLGAEIPAGCLGENIILKGITNLTSLPAGTFLIFRRTEKHGVSAALSVWGENTPCVLPGREIQERFKERSGIEKNFPKAAEKKRGLVAFVYLPGMIKPGFVVTAHPPV